MENNEYGSIKSFKELTEAISSNSGKISEKEKAVREAVSYGKTYYSPSNITRVLFKNTGIAPATLFVIRRLKAWMTR